MRSSGPRRRSRSGATTRNGGKSKRAGTTDAASGVSFSRSKLAVARSSDRESSTRTISSRSASRPAADAGASSRSANSEMRPMSLADASGADWLKLENLAQEARLAQPRRHGAADGGLDLAPRGSASRWRPWRRCLSTRSALT